MVTFSYCIDNFMELIVDEFFVFGSSFDICLANLSTVLKHANLVLN